MFIDEGFLKNGFDGEYGHWLGIFLEKWDSYDANKEIDKHKRWENGECPVMEIQDLVGRKVKITIEEVK